MENFFTHYYLFKATGNNNKFFELVCKHGCYEPLEKRKKHESKWSSVQINNFYCHESEAGKIRLLNPFYEELIGVATTSTNDTIIVSYNFQKLSVELFIAQGTKLEALMLLELINKIELIAEMNLIRQRAFSLS